VVAVLIVLVVIIVIGVLIGLWGVITYNGLIRLRNLVQEAWQQIDVELTRRHDLIPNLVETVKGYAGHERETLDAVVRGPRSPSRPSRRVSCRRPSAG
jgi:LemA protein